MKRYFYAFAIILLMVAVQFNSASARSMELYPGDPSVITPINETLPPNFVRFTMCTNCENAMGMQGQSWFTYQGNAYLETGWTLPGNSIVVSNFYPTTMLSNAVWYCIKEEINQPGGWIIYKFDY